MEASYSKEKVGTAFLLTLFFLLSVLFGATYLFVFVAAGFSLLFLLLRQKLRFNKLAQTKVVARLWISFIAALLASSWYTKNIPLTLDSLLLFATGCFAFFSILLLKKSSFSRDLFLFFLKSVVFLLAIFSLFFFLFPAWATLPHSNQLSQIGGHSHTGYIILLLLPYFWSDWKKTKQKVLQSLILVVLYAAVIFSSGRLVWFLTGLQAIGLVLLFFRHSKDKEKLQKIYVSLLAICTAVLLFATLFVVPSEPRPRYWQQATSALQEYPIFGYGPGTFGLISHKYAQFPHAYSGYAHNAILQQFAELGVLGGLSYLSLFGGLLYFGYTKKKSSLFLLSMQSSVFVALFDFDWHLAGYFYLVLALIALQLREQSKSVKSRKTTSLFRYLLATVAFFILAIAAVVAVVDFQLSRGKHAAGFQLFPYFSYHRLLFQNNLTQSAQIRRFEDIYLFHPEVLPTVATDPWQALAGLGSQNKTQLTSAEAKQLAVVILQTKLYDYTPDYGQQVLLASELARLSSSNRSLLQIAYLLDDWVMQNAPAFSQDTLLNASCSDISELFSSTGFIEPTQFGTRRYLFVYLFNLLANKAMTQEESGFAKDIVVRMSELVPDDYWVGQQVKNFPGGYWENAAEITNSSATQLGLLEPKARCHE